MTGLNHATTSSVKDLATKEVCVYHNLLFNYNQLNYDLFRYVFSGITNILGCIQKSLHEDKFAEQRNITLVPIKSDDTTQMLENAEIVISGIPLHLPHRSILYIFLPIIVLHNLASLIYVTLTHSLTHL